MFERTGCAAVPMDIVPSATILFIDGYDHDREYWVRRINISSPEYLVLEADTGAAGLSLCRSRRIDCVVAELRLPDMSGFQVLLQLVPYARCPGIAVVMLSRLSYP
jgi:DNA-binding response OmpR family regulator